VFVINLRTEETSFNTSTRNIWQWILYMWIFNISYIFFTIIFSISSFEK